MKILSAVNPYLDKLIGEKKLLDKTVHELLSNNPFFYKSIDSQRIYNIEELRVDYDERSAEKLTYRDLRIAKIVYYSLLTISAVVSGAIIITSFSLYGWGFVIASVTLPIFLGIIIGSYKALNGKGLLLTEKFRYRVELLGCYTKRGMANFLFTEAIKRVVYTSLVTGLIYINFMNITAFLVLPCYWASRDITNACWKWGEGYAKCIPFASKPLIPSTSSYSTL